MSPLTSTNAGREGRGSQHRRSGLHVGSLVVVVEVAAVVDDVVKFRAEISFKGHVAVVVVVAGVGSDVGLGIDRWWREGCSVTGAVRNFGPPLESAPPPSHTLLLPEASRLSTQTWQHDLLQLFHNARDRFPDVVWELHPDDDHDSTEEVWGHKGDHVAVAVTS